MTAKVIVITGGTSGLGQSVARHLLSSEPSTTVVLACRNVVKAEAVATELAAVSRPPVVLSVPLDLACLASVRAYALALKASLQGRNISVLINNAGIGGGGSGGPVLTGDGLELMLQSNHVGHLLLTLLLLPCMAPGGVIINVSSGVHDPTHGGAVPSPEAGWPGQDPATAGDRLQAQSGLQARYDAILATGQTLPTDTDRQANGRRYARSKLCNILFTYSLALRLSGAVPWGVDLALAQALTASPAHWACKLPGHNGRGIRVLAFNPGLMLDTSFFSNIAGSFAGTVVTGLSRVARWLPGLGPRVARTVRTADESGRGLAQLVTGAIDSAQYSAYFSMTYDDELGHATVTLKPSSAFSRSEAGLYEASEELWKASVRWARLTQDELAAVGLESG